MSVTRLPPRTSLPNVVVGNWVGAIQRLLLRSRGYLPNERVISSRMWA